jgi:putative flippase GtrA
LVVGGFATVIDMLTMAIILYLFNPKLYEYNLINTIFSNSSPSNIATIVGTGTGFILGLVFNYFLSIAFVFNKTNTDFAKTKTGFISFAALSAIGLLIHTVGMALGYGILKINEWLIKIFLTLVVLVFNYTTRKKIIFKGEKKEAVN